MARLTGQDFGAVVRPGERLLSCDLAGPGSWVLAVDDATQTTIRFSTGVEVTLRENHGSLIVTAVDVERALVVIPRTEATIPNAWLVTPDGFHQKFFVGDAVQDVIALPDGVIAVTYFDEGFGGPMSNEGVAVFGIDGSFLRGFVSAVGEPIVDCYAAVRVGRRSVGLWPYPDWQLTEWDIESGRDRRHVVPGTVRGARSISHSGDRWWFFSPYNRPHTVFEWRIGSSKVTEVGVLRGPLRGLAGGRFMDYTDDQPRVVTMTSPEHQLPFPE